MVHSYKIQLIFKDGQCKCGSSRASEISEKKLLGALNIFSRW